MATTLEKLVVEITADATELKKGVDAAKESIKGVGEAAKGATENVENFNGRLRDPKTGRFLPQAKTDFEGVGKAAGDAGDNTKKFGDETENAGKRSSASLKNMIPSWQAVGAAIGAATVALAAGLGYAGKAFMDFEQTATNAASVTGLTGQAYEDALGNIKAVSQELGENTVFSASEAASAMYDLASAGFDVANMTSGELEPILNLASGTQSDLTNTTQIVTDAISQFGLTTADSGRIADVYSKAIGESKATLDKLGTSMNYVGPVAQSLGWSVEETAGSLEVLYNAGMDGEMAGTALRGAIAGLITPTNEAKTVIQNMGLTMEDVNPQTHDFSDILRLLSEHGLTASQAMTIFGDRAGPAMLTLTSSYSDVDKFTQSLQAAGGAAKDMADKQLDTLAGSVEMLKSAFEGLVLQVGEALAPSLRTAADYLTALIPSIRDFISNLQGLGSSPVFAILKEFGGSILDNITDALSGAYSAIQEFVGRGGLERMGEAIKIVIDNMASLNRTLNDLGVYKAMGVAVGLIVNGLLGFVDLISITIIEFDKFRRSMLNTIADVLDAIGTVVPGADKMAAGIRKSLEKVPSEAAAALAPFPGVVTTAVQSANTQATAAAQSTSKNVSTEFSKMYGLTNSALQGFPGMVAGNINAAAGPASSAAKYVALSAVGSLNTGMTPMAPNTAAIMGRVSSSISGAGGSMYSAAASAGQQAVNGLASKTSQVQALANQMYAALANMKNAYNSALYYSTSMPSSGHGGASSSTGSTGIQSQGGDGTGEKNVKIREVHATGGLAGYTGWHWMEAGEIAIPKQYDWNKAVVSPVIRAMQAQQAPVRAVQAEAVTKKVIVTINNKSSDVSTLNRVITKAAKVNATARAI